MPGVELETSVPGGHVVVALTGSRRDRARMTDSRAVVVWGQVAARAAAHG